MQELIRKIEMMELADDVINPLGMIKGLSKELIKEEKQQIIEAAKYGMYFGDPQIQNAPEESEQYYDKTFKP